VQGAGRSVCWHCIDVGFWWDACGSRCFLTLELTGFWKLRMGRVGQEGLKFGRLGSFCFVDIEGFVDRLSVLVGNVVRYAVTSSEIAARLLSVQKTGANVSWIHWTGMICPGKH